MRPSVRQAVTVVLRARLACLLLLLAAITGADAIRHQALASHGPANDVVVTMKDGLLTATFTEQTSNAALRAALPGLLARGVRAISLRGSPIDDITSLAAATNLQSLDLCGTQVRDTAPLAALHALRSLNLQFTPVHDLGPIEGLANLKSLNLGGTKVQDLTPLTSLVSLEELVIAVTAISDLRPLARLRQLTSLDAGSTWISDLRPLADVVSLRSLNLNGTPVDDVQALHGMVNLQELDLGGSRISDVRPLAGLRTLHSLNLEGTQVADVSPLAALTSLESLGLGGSPAEGKAPSSMTRPQSQAAVPAAPPATDAVLFWNDQTNRAIQATNMDAFQASRALALESLAVLDAIRSLDGSPAFLVRLPNPGRVPIEAAVAAAAHGLLGELFPSQRTVLDAALAGSLATVPAGPARDRALLLGAAMAENVMAMREGDGSRSAAGAPGDGNATGQWRPTPPDFLPPMDPQWATMKPFALTSPAQFRPPGPLVPGTQAYRKARAMVASLGGAQSTERTAEQTEIAHYWSDAIGTYAPAGHWNAIAAALVAPMQLGLTAEAELFAQLNLAMADAGIAMADAKYTYWSWRPITAIRSGDDSDLPSPNWTPLLTTPNHPGYISGHSSFSGAAAVVLTSWFGTRPFTFTSASLPGVRRSFANFEQAAEEAAQSRIYGGIHFPFDNVDGLATGRAVGARVLAVFQQSPEDRGPFIMVDRPQAGGTGEPGLMGCALDNLSPLSSVTAQLDGRPSVDVPVDAQGEFSLSPQYLNLHGPHEVMLSATSITGRTTALRLTLGSDTAAR